MLYYKRMGTTKPVGQSDASQPSETPPGKYPALSGGLDAN